MIVQFDKNTQRIAAIDWLRGLVMMRMALDHTSWFFNEHRIFADSVLLYEAAIYLLPISFSLAGSPISVRLLLFFWQAQPLQSVISAPGARYESFCD